MGLGLELGLESTYRCGGGEASEVPVWLRRREAEAQAVLLRQREGQG